MQCCPEKPEESDLCARESLAAELCRVVSKLSVDKYGDGARLSRDTAQEERRCAAITCLL